MRTIGVISDTHGLLRPEAVAALAGSDLILHAGDVGTPLPYLIHEIEHLDLDPAAAGFSLVVYGHTHEPSLRTKDEVISFNPGAAGRRRFRLPVTVGRVEIAGGRGIDARVIHLDV